MIDAGFRVLFLLGAALLASACGGGGGGSNGNGSAPPVQNASVGGIWEGTDSVSGLPVLGLATEGGDFHFIREDGVQYFGTATVSGSSVSARFDGVTSIGWVFEDGTTSGTGTFSGSVQARSTLSGSTSFRTSGGLQSSGTLSLRYDALYERDSSLQAIAGNFREPLFGYVVNVSASGAVFSQDPDSGCVVNGTVSVVDARFNAYRVQYTYSSCSGADAVLNGVTFRGLATLDDRTSPEQLIVGATAQAGGAGLSIVWVFERT